MKENHKKSLELIDELIKELSPEELKELISKYSEPKNDIREISREDVFDYTDKGYCTVGILKEHLEKFNIPDNAPILIQRVEDVYYEKHNWGIYLKKGMDYCMEDHNKLISKDPKFLKSMMEQYHPAWSPASYGDDKDILFLDLHY